MIWQTSVLKYLESIRSDGLTIFFEGITITAESIIVVLTLLAIYWCINREFGLKFAFIMILSIVINTIIKNSIKFPRPFQLNVVEAIRAHTATGYSFPSGHTQVATTYWLVLMNEVKHKFFTLFAIIMIMLVALSRLYLGVHWPQDVIAGIFLGIISTIIGQYLFNDLREKNSWKKHIFILFLLITTLIFNISNNYVKSIAALIGIIIGAFLENKYAKDKVYKTLYQKVIKFLMGCTSLIILAEVLKLFLPQVKIFVVLRYILIGIWVTFVVPYSFRAAIDKRN